MKSAPTWLLLAAFVAPVACDNPPVTSLGGPSDAALDTTQDARQGLVERCADVSFEDAAQSLLPCDIETILSEKCQRCHDSKERTDVCREEGTCLAAPFPLSSWADTRQEVGRRPAFIRMHSAVESDFMPLTAAGITPPVEALTPDEKARLLDWLDRCAPPAAGDACEVDGDGG